MRRTPWFCCLAFVAGCGLTEEVFVAGADFEPCQSNVDVCQTNAGCDLAENLYIEGDFPGFRNFVVKTMADTIIVVNIFFKDAVHPGEDTEITWFEVGCHDSYKYENQGADIFEEAGSDQLFSQEQKVRESGPHLIEIYSDAWVHYFLRVELKEPL